MSKRSSTILDSAMFVTSIPSSRTRVFIWARALVDAMSLGFWVWELLLMMFRCGEVDWW